MSLNSKYTKKNLLNSGPAAYFSFVRGLPVRLISV